MFCHHCARQSSKHKVNKTHAELIEIPILYILLTHLCFSTYNFKLLYTTWRFICSYLLESFMLVLRVFLFFFYLCLFVYSKETSELQMTSIIFWKNIYRWPTKCITVKHNCANNCWHIICSIEHFHSLYLLFTELNSYGFYLSLHRDARRR